MMTIEIVKSLQQRGVRIPNPESVEIGLEVDIDRIAGEEGMLIHSGCRIYGRDTFIAAGAKLGTEGPVTAENCLIAPGVELKGGFFKDSVFPPVPAAAHGCMCARARFWRNTPASPTRSD